MKNENIISEKRARRGFAEWRSRLSNFTVPGNTTCTTVEVLVLVVQCVCTCTIPCTLLVPNTQYQAVKSTVLVL